MTSSPEDIAFNKPVNGLNKYKDKYDKNGEEFKMTLIMSVRLLFTMKYFMKR
jgi:hypothetical protein